MYGGNIKASLTAEHLASVGTDMHHPRSLRTITISIGLPCWRSASSVGRRTVRRGGSLAAGSASANGTSSGRAWTFFRAVGPRLRSATRSRSRPRRDPQSELHLPLHDNPWISPTAMQEGQARIKPLATSQTALAARQRRLSASRRGRLTTSWLQQQRTCLWPDRRQRLKWRD